MVKEIIKYPNPNIRLISANVRFFNDELKSWISDMIDTMKANDLQALSAILIGIQYNIIVIKENNIYTPYINARIIKHGTKTTGTERSVYYEGISVDVDRYEEITIVYEDESGESHNINLQGEAARVLQHQLDYSFGSTFVDRVSKPVKEQINSYLEFGLVKDANNGSCPTVFYRDYARKASQYMLWLISLTLLTPFFVADTLLHTVYICDLYAFGVTVLLIFCYILYARYETLKYKQCTSCQTGNIIGTAAILSAQLLILLIIVFFWVKH